MGNFRKIKMSERYIRRRWDNKKVPSMLIQGEWVLNAGFLPGMNCSVKVEQGRITIISL